MTTGEDMGHGAGKDVPPWLQPVPEDEERGTQVTSKKMLVSTIAGALIILSLFVAVIWYLYDGTTGQAPIHVPAPKTVLKEKPTDPGGMEVAHQDKAIFDQAGGVKPRKQVSLGEQPETPVTEIRDDPVGDVIEAATSDDARKPALQAPAATMNATPETTTDIPVSTSSEPEPAAAADTVGPAVPAYRVQLGAYGNETSAARAWRTVRGRFPDRFREKTANYEAVQAGDRTLYRLRVGPYLDRAAADQVCLALRANEQACIVVNP